MNVGRPHTKQINNENSLRILLPFVKLHTFNFVATAKWGHLVKIRTD